MERILLIEDEDNIRKIIAYDLMKAGYDIVECADGEEALHIVEKESFDVMIIDWMLPSVSGIDIVKKLRSKGIDAILMMLTAKDEETDILNAFDSGVDDYMTKPFSPRELLARVHAHLKRRVKQESKDSISIGDLHIDIKKYEAYVGTQLISLTKKEYDLIEYFIRNCNIVLSRDDILNEIWGFNYDGDTRIVDVHVFKLRAKLETSNVHIRSLRSVGYIMELKHE